MTALALLSLAFLQLAAPQLSIQTLVHATQDAIQIRVHQDSLKFHLQHSIAFLCKATKLAEKIVQMSPFVLNAMTDITDLPALVCHPLSI